MSLTERDIRAIADYARIDLPEDQLPAMTTYMNDVIETLKPIVEYDLEGIEPTYHPIGSLANVMREDTAGASLTQEEALSNAPQSEDGCFKVPAILGGEQ